MARDSIQTNELQRQAVEDYLKSIYLLAETETPVSTSRLAEARAVKAASATGMIQRLARLDLVNYEKHHGVTLTEAGEKIALDVLRRHRLLELFLTIELGFGWDEVHEEAERLEHVLSDKLTERITAVLGDPQFDPHGEPIPARDGTMTAVHTRPLTSLTPGSHAVVSRVANDNDCELLSYLAVLGLVPGTAVQVIEKAPFNGPLTIKVSDESQIVGFHAAEMVHVQIQ